MVFLAELNSFTDLDELTRPKTVVACSVYVETRTGKMIKNQCFLKEENICYKMVYNNFLLGQANHQVFIIIIAFQT